MTRHAAPIDLRSDTVTLPTPAMREAMYRAELGDDVFGEDPTVNRLQAMAAARLGKEAALFVPSGTMANLVCLLSHCARGEEAIMGHLSHTFLFEAGGSAAVGGIHPRTVTNQLDGTMSLEDIEAAVRDPSNAHLPQTRLICLENTHNRCSGAVLAPGYTAQVKALADRHGLFIHMDGARLFNAAVALRLPPSELVRDVDSVSFCLSKGLSAPVGSLVCGTATFIARAHRNRKVLGGAMRQAGVLAAAGIVALETMIDRLAEDHANAHRLAEGLAQVPGILLDPARVPTNIVLLGLAEGTLSSRELVAALASQGVLVNATGPRQLRAVTHYGINSEDIERALTAVRSAMAMASAS
ncbi:MAG TPA: low-specificity L-threonine aldolase [Anaerolineae bacterium]|nr:low-specificity L-threonine aldolase [Anaerolineae bacterium]